MAMAQAAYFVAQQIYAGWALFGIVLFGALAANLAHTIVLRRLGRSFGYALASFLLIAANLAIFFVWTFPTNQATNNWTVVPNNWNELRIQWEYSHAANAMLTFAAPIQSRLMDCPEGCSYADRETSGHFLAPKIQARRVG